MNTTATINTQCNKIAAKIISTYFAGEDGGTFNFDSIPQNFNQGYLASYKSPSIILSEQKIPSINELRELIKKLYFKASSSDYIGFWVSEGKIFIDLTRHIQSKKSAILFGISNDHLAIWDCTKNESINLN
jgi:exopolysaccharide biosynthesis protein